MTAPSLPSPPATPADRKVDFSAGLQALAKTCQAVGAILLVVSPVALFWVNLMTSQYLAAFGQPGLSSFGDVASYSAAMWPIVLVVVVILGGFVALPVFPRLLAASPAEHGFADAFGAMDEDAPRGALSRTHYVIAHSAALTATTLLILSFLLPSAWRYGWWFCIIASAASLIWAHERSKGHARRTRVRRLFQSLMVFAYANFVLVVWVAALDSALLDVVRPRLAGWGDLAGAAAAAGLVLATVGVHWLMSVSRWRAALGLGLMMIVAGAPLVNDRVLLGLALDHAKLGGGIPITYRPSAAKPDAARVHGCLVLAVGDRRIIWTPKIAGDDTTPCDWTAFRDRIKTGAALATARDVRAADQVQVLPREAL